MAHRVMGDPSQAERRQRAKDAVTRRLLGGRLAAGTFPEDEPARVRPTNGNGSGASRGPGGSGGCDIAPSASPLRSERPPTE